jgi:flagellum-specific ATP synthase
MLDASRYVAALLGVPSGRQVGRVTRMIGLAIECSGIAIPIGELCRIERAGEPLLAEMVGFKEGAAQVMPLGDQDGLVPGARVTPLGSRLSVQFSDAVLGRILDGLGRPIDGKGPIAGAVPVALRHEAISPLDRRPIDTPLPTGISAIDAFLTIGRGQRVGIFSGSGVGKSTLLGDIARETLADVNVIALVGERGREVGAFLEEVLGARGLERSVVVVATSDAPPLLRIKAASAAVALAEAFRARGRDVMLMFDSVTRYAAAMREVGLALGEPPTVKGYPPSFFSTIPRLVERLGRTSAGSITGLLTVLVDGDDMADPVADTMRGLLDGHVVLSRAIARSRLPAVDVGASVSRLMPRIVSPEHQDAAARVRRMLATYDDARDLIAVGAYRPGADPKVDKAVRSIQEAEALLAQRSGEGRSFPETVRRLEELAAKAE